MGRFDHHRRLWVNFCIKSMFATYAQDRYSLLIKEILLCWDLNGKWNLQITRDFYPKLLYFYEHLYKESSVSLLPRINKHVRCLVNGLTLSSDLNGSNCSSIVKDYWLGPLSLFWIVRFFFISSVIITDNVSSSDHTKSDALAYVQCFKFYNGSPDPLFK